MTSDWRDKPRSTASEGRVERDNPNSFIAVPFPGTPILRADFPSECCPSLLPIEKCSAKTITSGIVTNPNCIHSGVSLVRWIDLTGFVHGTEACSQSNKTERAPLFNQNMTERSRHRLCLQLVSVS